MEMEEGLFHSFIILDEFHVLRATMMRQAQCASGLKSPTSATTYFTNSFYYCTTSAREAVVKLVLMLLVVGGKAMVLVMMMMTVEGSNYRSW